MYILKKNEKIFIIKQEEESEKIDEDNRSKYALNSTYLHQKIEKQTQKQQVLDNKFTTATSNTLTTTQVDETEPSPPATVSTNQALVCIYNLNK